MIERHPALPDPFLVLEPKDSFGEYAHAYGDRIAEHYENRGVIVVPRVPIEFDREFFQQISFPEGWKKIGSANGIEKPVVIRDGATLRLDDRHPFVRAYKETGVAVYLQSQIASFNAQLRLGVATLFSRYHRLADANITWRLTETRAEGLHLDIFDQGNPLLPRKRLEHRVKVFVNIDAEPRRWRVSRDLPGILQAARSELPDALPDDINVVASVIDKVGALDGAEAHEVAYPTMSAVIVNAEVVSHEVVFGRRMVAGEFLTRRDDLLDPARHTHDLLRGWLEAAGYRIAPDAAAVAREYRDMLGAYEMIQLRAAEAARPKT